MFFGSKTRVPYSFGFDKIQIWETTKEIEVLFLVEYLNGTSHTFNNIPKLYYTLFPMETNLGLNDLDIKDKNVELRDRFISKLYKDFNISGWFTSLEDNAEIEICLFDKVENSKQLKLVDVINSKSDKYFLDSLMEIEIFPPLTFYKKTKDVIEKYNGRNFNEYNECVKSWIKDYTDDGMDYDMAYHSHYNLRLKLKI